MRGTFPLLSHPSSLVELETRLTLLFSFSSRAGVEIGANLLGNAILIYAYTVLGRLGEILEEGGGWL